MQNKKGSARKMECTDKEWQHCRVEKMGCPGCYYDEIEIGEYIRNRNGYIDKVKKIIKKDEYMHSNYYSCDSTMASSYKNEIVIHDKNITKLILAGDVIVVKKKKYEVIFDTSFNKLGILIPTKDGIRHSSIEYLVMENLIESIVTKERFTDEVYKIEV